MKSTLSEFLSAALFLIFLPIFSGCGKYAPPLSPEKVAPQAVGDLLVEATEKTVILKWTTPESDRRDKSLKFIDGFIVYRKTIASKKDITDNSILFDLLAEIEDKAIADREIRREQVRELGGISRRVKVDPILAAHQFEDTTPVQGSSYLYKIVPINQGDVEGEVRQFVSITFRGTTSDINLVNAKQLGIEDFVDQGEAVVQ